MYKIKVISVGKTKEAWLKDAIEEYVQRLKGIATIEWILTKTTEHLNENLKKESSFICLDLGGKALTSEEFSTFLIDELFKHGSRLTFVIGGAEGIPKEITAKAAGLLSFSRLTFTHQIVRLLLIEQIYRGFEIEKGSGYHK
jgi:23S rRNA (pseudouridine1915-N3)-methyltransferase